MINTVFMNKHLATKPASRLSFETAADGEHIGAANDFVERALTEFAVQGEERGHICVAVDEAITNVALYAYPDAKGSVKITLEKTGQRIIITIIDSGQPFNPLLHPVPDTSAGIEQRAIGGLGIHLMRHMMDKLDYRRMADTNQLILEKNIGGNQ